MEALAGCVTTQSERDLGRKGDAELVDLRGYRSVYYVARIVLRGNQ